MNEKLKVMAIVCHPADAIDHAGGTLCLHAERGDDVAVIVCTHGVDSHDIRRNEAIRLGHDRKIDDHKTSLDRKEREVVNGLAILGVMDVRFLRFPDELVTVTRELIEAIATELADFQPHLLILHNPTEHLGLADGGHADTAIAALKAISLVHAPRFLQKQKGRSFPAQVFFTEMYGSTNQLESEGMRHGNVLIDITPVVDRKVRAMDCLHSQYYPGNLARKCIEAVNGRMGLHWRLPYAEAFQTLNPHIYSHLPANEYLIQKTNTPASKGYKKMRITVNDVPFEGEPKSR